MTIQADAAPHSHKEPLQKNESLCAFTNRLLFLLSLLVYTLLKPPAQNVTTEIVFIFSFVSVPTFFSLQILAKTTCLHTCLFSSKDLDVFLAQ